MMTKVYYKGREISHDYAKMLEDNGQAHYDDYVSGGEHEDPRIIMASGPGNNWLEHQDPKLFLMHVFGHTCTWKEMAEKWEREAQYGMGAVATALRSLNHWITQILKERAEQAETTTARDTA